MELSWGAMKGRYHFHQPKTIGDTNRYLVIFHPQFLFVSKCSNEKITEKIGVFVDKSLSIKRCLDIGQFSESNKSVFEVRTSTI